VERALSRVEASHKHSTRALSDQLEQCRRQLKSAEEATPARAEAERLRQVRGADRCRELRNVVPCVRSPFFTHATHHGMNHKALQKTKAELIAEQEVGLCFWLWQPVASLC
jgi:hypothetical protein